MIVSSLPIQNTQSSAQRGLEEENGRFVPTTLLSKVPVVPRSTRMDLVSQMQTQSMIFHGLSYRGCAGRRCIDDTCSDYINPPMRLFWCSSFPLSCILSFHDVSAVSLRSCLCDSMMMMTMMMMMMIVKMLTH